MTNSSLHDELAGLLRREVELAEALRDSLAREHEALRGHALEAIREAAADKELLVRQLETLACSQNDLLRRAGFDPTRDDLDQALRRSGMGQVYRQWTELTRVLTDCRHRNQVNGGMIEMSRRFAQQILDTIRGGTNAGTLYGPSGQASSTHGRDPIATA